MYSTAGKKQTNVRQKVARKGYLPTFLKSGYQIIDSNSYMGFLPFSGIATLQ